MLCFVPHDSLFVVRASGFSSRRDIVLSLLQKRNSYKLIQVVYISATACLKVYLFVILPFDSKQGERGSLKGYGLQGIFVRNRVSILAILVSDWVQFLHFSLAISPGQTMPTQHIATLLGATCCVSSTTVLRPVALGGVGLSLWFYNTKIYQLGAPIM